MLTGYSGALKSQDYKKFEIEDGVTASHLHQDRVHSGSVDRSMERHSMQYFFKSGSEHNPVASDSRFPVASDSRFPVASDTRFPVASDTRFPVMSKRGVLHSGYIGNYGLQTHHRPREIAPDREGLEDDARTRYIHEMKYQGIHDAGVNREFFSEHSIEAISREITRRIEEQLGRPILVPRRVIKAYMGSVYENKRGRPEYLADLTINGIVSYIVAEKQIAEQNNKLDIWVQNYTGDHGLLRHQKVKLNNKRPNKMYFGMNY